jgi:hypothetical protein
MRRIHKRNGSPMNRQAITQKGDIGIVTIFVFIVGRGWQTLLSTQGLYISIAVGALVGTIATLLAYAIASERTYHPNSRAVWLAYFFVLFNLSALGTINAMFVMFQSSNIFREQIESTGAAVVSLRDVGAASIETSDFDSFNSNVMDKWRNLKAELDNPVLCGQGPVASNRIQELQSLLPNFRALAGGGRCDKVAQLIASYQKQIDSLMKESPIYLASKTRVDLKKRVIAESRGLLDELNVIGKSLNSDFRLSSVKGQIFDIAERYSVIRQEIGITGATSPEKIPLKIDVRSVSALGDIGQVLPFIVSRLTDVSTYVYLVIALVLDIAVILAFTRTLREGPTRGQREMVGKPRKV